MKTTVRVLVYLLIIVATFFAGIGMKWAVTNLTNPQTPIEQTVVKAELLIPSVEPATPVPEITKSAQPATITAGVDLKRGSFFSEDIHQQLEVSAQEQTTSNVRMMISNIIRKDTRAFVKVCMELLGTNERLDFGTTDLNTPSGKAKNFFVQTNIPSLGNARCIVLEFVGIPQDTISEGWKFTMEWVGYLAPDEGTECAAYLRRAQSIDWIRQSSVSFACKAAAGSIEFKIENQPADMSDDQAKKMINQIVSGVINGPWIFAANIK